MAYKSAQSTTLTTNSNHNIHRRVAISQYAII
jgi:hypothetical protein